MRPILIRHILPLLFCMLPFLIAALVLMCIPHKATRFFLDHMGMMEVLIMTGGIALFSVQMILCWMALRWRGPGFDERTDRWLSNLAQAAEWFPMLGLIGTVAGILDAFSTHGAGSVMQPSVIAPAITATGAGLFMALINILPTWIVLLGRDLILLLSGAAPRAAGSVVMIHMPRRSVTRFFIPLIDVLILLFCIFLLMEFNSETKADAESEKAEDYAFENSKLLDDLQRRIKELHKFEELRPQLNELDQLRQELERLKNANQQDLRNRLYVRTIDYDGKDGSISFYDESRVEQPVIKLTDAKAAKALIERHTLEAEARGRVLYYQFILPRPYRFIYPTNTQKTEYAKWFAGAANSLEVKAK